MIVDTGVLVAAANSSDPDALSCQQLLRSAQGPLVVPPLVIAEAGFLIQRVLGSAVESVFLRSLARPRFRIAEVGPDDLRRMAQLVEQYGDLRLGTTDASVVALAERLGVSEVATLDRRHFTVIRPNHVETLTLRP